MKDSTVVEEAKVVMMSDEWREERKKKLVSGLGRDDDGVIVLGDTKKKKKRKEKRREKGNRRERHEQWKKRYTSRHQQLEDQKWIGLRLGLGLKRRGWFCPSDTLAHGDGCYFCFSLSHTHCHWERQMFHSLILYFRQTYVDFGSYH